MINGMAHSFATVPRLFVLAVLVTSSACASSAPAAPAQPSTTALPVATAPAATPATHPADLINKLRAGGYVIYFRHTKTDFSQKDTVADYDNCAGQRNLTDTGRDQARGIGIAIKALGIPIGRIVASPYCRTRETAELIFGRYERADHYETAKSITKDILSVAPAAGPNTIIVAHGFIMRDIAGVVLEEGDAMIFKPSGPTDQGALARIPSALWTAWAAGSADAPRDVLRTVTEFALPAGKYPHDVAPAADGTVWWTAQSSGELGKFDPRDSSNQMIALGAGSKPHGVIIGPDGAAWITDGGLNALVRVDAKTLAVKTFALPAARADANLNTAAFDARGMLWFTGQSGIYGRLDTQTGALDVWDAPKGRGPYGIASAPDGGIFFASLAGNYIARVDLQSGAATVIEPPTKNQGARRVWLDSKGKVWVSEWNSGQLSVYDPGKQTWQAWKLPGGKAPQTYAVFVDGKDGVWVSDFGNNAITNYAPNRKEWKSYPLPSAAGNVRQLAGRAVETWHEIWGAESGANKLIMIRAE
jgi:virginiamycin B lyase